MVASLNAKLMVRIGVLRGEFATLTKANGASQLRETSGAFTAFRADGLLGFMEDPNGNRLNCGWKPACFFQPRRRHELPLRC